MKYYHLNLTRLLLHLSVYWRVQGTSIIGRVLNYTTDSAVYDIFVVEDHESNSDIVYAAGYYEDDGSMTDTYNACYWKDEGGDGVDIEKYILPSVPEGEVDNNNVEANSIFVSDSNIYVAGFYDTDDYSIACVWRDEDGDGQSISRTDLPGNTSTDSEAHGLIVGENKIYACGFFSAGSDACYWRYDQTDPSGSIDEIFITSSSNTKAFALDIQWLNRPPSVGIDFPTDGSTVTEPFLTVSGTANAPDDNIDFVAVTIDGQWYGGTEIFDQDGTGRYRLK